MLDVLDLVLNLTSNSARRDWLNHVLLLGASEWMVAPDRRGLQRWVLPATQAAYQMAAAPEDMATDELRETWRQAFGRHPDPGP
jgi:hypothetical protein